MTDAAAGAAAGPRSGAAGERSDREAGFTEIAITAADDPRLADYHGLTDVALRTRLEPAGGLFIAEGELVVRRAVDAGLVPRSVLCAEGWAPAVRALLAQRSGAAGAPVPLFVGTEAVVSAVAGFHVHRGALAAMHRPPPRDPLQVAASARRLLVCEDVNTHTNLGALLRTGAALGVDGVLLSPRSTDPLYRRAVRVSMGQVFAVPWARCTNWPGDLLALRAAGVHVVALTPREQAVPLPRFRPPPGPVALLVGAEGPGLSDAALAAADTWVRIPMAAGVDSLNVAVAAAVACYALGPGLDGAGPAG